MIPNIDRPKYLVCTDEWKCPSNESFIRLAWGKVVRRPIELENGRVRKGSDVFPFFQSNKGGDRLDFLSPVAIHFLSEKRIRWFTSVKYWSSYIRYIRKGAYQHNMKAGLGVEKDNAWNQQKNITRQANLKQNKRKLKDEQHNARVRLC